MQKELNKYMTVEEFEKGYYYAAELKEFAKSLGIQVGTLRKNEIEEYIKSYLLGTGYQTLPKSISNRENAGARDHLSVDTVITNYVSDKATKTFLKEEIYKRDQSVKDKSGQWYWLNDWRKEQIRNKKSITYQNLIDKLYELMTTEGKLPQIPSTRYNNFITDYLLDPDNKGSTRQKAIKEWERLKKMPVRKTYIEYKQFLQGNNL